MKIIPLILAIVACGPCLQARSQPSAQPAREKVEPRPSRPAYAAWPTGFPASSQSPAAQAIPPSADRMDAAQVNDLLRKIYNTAYRVSDLLSLLQPDKWKISETERKSLDATLELLRADLKALEDARMQFSGQPQNLAMGGRLDAAVRSALLNVDAVTRSVWQYESPGEASQYTQAHDQLADLERSLASYLDSLRAGAANPPGPGAPQGQPPTSEPAGAAPQTERITTPAAPLPPATTAQEVGYMTPEQVKALTHQIYLATFRLNDLLTQVQPGRWKVPEPVRDHFNLSSARLRADLKSLEASRSAFAEQTDDPYPGYQTYEAIPTVVSDLKTVDEDIALFEGPSMARLFAQPAQWLDESHQALKSYLEFILRSRNQAVRTYESNLAACQNTLNYAMRSQAAPAQSMEPVRFVRPLQSAKIRRKEAEEAARHGGQATGTDAGEAPAGEGEAATSGNKAAASSESQPRSSGAAAGPAKSAKKRKAQHAKKKATEAAH